MFPPPVTEFQSKPGTWPQSCEGNLTVNATYQLDSRPPFLRPENEEVKDRTFVIRIHLADGSVESFERDVSSEAQSFRDKIHPARLFLPSRLVLVGERSKSVYVTAQIVRVDFLQELNGGWNFPPGYTDIVELSEEDFRNTPVWMTQIKCRNEINCRRWASTL